MHKVNTGYSVSVSDFKSSLEYKIIGFIVP